MNTKGISKSLLLSRLVATQLHYEHSIQAHSIRQDAGMKWFALMLQQSVSGHGQEAAARWVRLSCWHTHCVLGLLTRRANSTITVLPLKVFFVAHWAHAVCARIPVKSAASGTKHRHLATVSFLSHSPFFYKPEIDTQNPAFRGLRKLFFYSWHLKIWNFL